MTSEIDGKLKAKPENNPWYLLATLYGQPSFIDLDLQARNRRAWNRYMSSIWLNLPRWLKVGNRAPHPAEDSTPFSADELAEVKKAFIERHRSAASTANAIIPELKPDDQIDFSDVSFNNPFCVRGFFFPIGFNFSRVTFSGFTDFMDTTFSRFAVFQGATFSGKAAFDGATFYGNASFAGATFSDDAVFERASFSAVADFGAMEDTAHARGATFSRLADFGGATFSSIAVFQSADFSGPAAIFLGATFSSSAAFGGATFSYQAAFGGATFSGFADFRSATFSGATDFTGAIFQSTISFVNVEMKGPTSFEASTFSVEPPPFFGATLHEGTVWRQVRWPAPPEDVAKAGKFVDAYERLKLEMDRLKKHEDELEFFALELQCRRVLSGPFRGLPIALYGLLCNYGRSYFRPLVGLLVTVAVGTVLCLPHFGISKYPQAIGLSLANTFAMLGFRKDFIHPHVIENLSRALKVVSAVQSVFGIGLLFLLGLALRNRFRMK